MNQDTTVSELYWKELKAEAAKTVAEEPLLRAALEKSVLTASGFDQALARVCSYSLANAIVGRTELYAMCMQAYESCPELLEDAACDMRAVIARDPASADSTVVPFLFLKGPHVLEIWRVAHWLWQQGRKPLARYVQCAISDVFGADIHPAARIGRGIMLDHALGIVIGETAVVGDMVSMLHGVTLGGTGKVSGDRHPKVGRGVMIGAGAKVLGNIHIGEGAKIGAGSVVLDDVPPHTTVAGVPARSVGRPIEYMPSLGMDQTLHDDYCPVMRNKEIL